jgi:hypothetical protein
MLTITYLDNIQRDPYLKEYLLTKTMKTKSKEGYKMRIVMYTKCTKNKISTSQSKSVISKK